MKNIIIIIAIALVATSCGLGSASKEMKMQNDSLLMVNSLKDSHMNSLITSLIDIQDNLQTIKEKENLISVNVSSGDKVNTSMKEQINRDIQMIYDLMVQNKEKITQLESQLKGSGAKNANLNKLIAGLNKQIETQAMEIERLNGVLAAKDIEITNLGHSVRGLKSSVDSLSAEQRAVKNKLQATTEELEKGFYIIGSKKELKEKSIVTSDGLFSSKKIMTGNYESDFFTKVNVTQIEEIPLMSKKAKVLSNHPKDSYSLNADANGNLTLVIKNKTDFWSVSKYLVVQVN
ncbi:MAG: Cbp1 family collagen-binding glycoprotein adhesin [Breznakibacter sp.]